jgi:large subunit ribosomal protein L25
MVDVTLAAHTGRENGSGSARRLRRAGAIPAVVYGHGVAATPITVEARALRAVLSTDAGTNVVVELDVDGTHHLAMAKDIQRHPVRGTVAHVDFLVVNRDEIVTVDIPVNLVGESAEIRHAGGTVSHELFSLTARCTPDRIPTGIDVDISGLTIGSAIRVSDLVLPPGVTTEVDPETPIAVGHAAVVEVVEAPEAEAEGEAVEGGEADGAEQAGGGGGAADS